MNHEAVFAWEYNYHNPKGEKGKLTLEEACDLLGVSPDENFDLEQLEKNYDARVAKLKPENLGRVHISML